MPYWIRAALFTIVAVVGTFGAAWYVHHRIRRHFELGRRAAWSLLAFLCGGPASMVADRRIDPRTFPLAAGGTRRVESRFDTPETTV